jgi:hypothetical protein
VENVRTAWSPVCAVPAERDGVTTDPDGYSSVCN